jgi:opacity protein-like surface antigen
LTERWELFAGADIGGFGVGSNLTWQWLAGLGYRFELLGRKSFLRAGWRMLDIDYTDGGFKWDVTYSGPILGMTVRF